jgi:hypothetical protein
MIKAGAILVAATAFALQGKAPPKYVDMSLGGEKLGGYGWKHDPKSGYYLMTSGD